MGLRSFSKIDPDFRGIRPVEGERDGHADACHTRPWHSCPAAVGVLRAAGLDGARRDLSTVQLADDQRWRPEGPSIWKIASDRR